jgi:hypothetical protein
MEGVGIRIRWYTRLLVVSAQEGIKFVFSWVSRFARVVSKLYKQKSKFSLGDIDSALEEESIINDLVFR